MTVRIIGGDCRERLRELPDASVQCCVTSPPYFGLRDYGVAGQIGLEDTPDAFVAEMVAVFREVRRVLRDDGTLWLNLGDSYSGSPPGTKRGVSASSTLAGVSSERYQRTLEQSVGTVRDKSKLPGIKPKDLIGIPWSVAKALQAPFYTGRIAAERDRTWLAAMIDGEGTICGFSHERADDGRTRTGAHVFITNSNDALLRECGRIWPASRSEHMAAGAGHFGSKAVERWIVHGAENKIALLAEMYPYLIAKKAQAHVAWNMARFVLNGKRDGHSSEAEAVRAKRQRLTEILADLNAGRPVDLPSWLLPMPSMFEQGYYLRQDIIWAKPNPMPESVTDRCTKAHEYLFLLSKSATYHYDAAAIAEAADPANHRDSPGVRRTAPGSEDHKGFVGGRHFETRNRRSVWTVATQPFSEAHFATFPPALIEPCILAGCPAGGVVLDPFGGAGTTGLVADRLGRDAILIELNPEYAAMAQKRIGADAGMFASVDADHPGHPRPRPRQARQRAVQLTEGPGNEVLRAPEP